MGPMTRFNRFLLPLKWLRYALLASLCYVQTPEVSYSQNPNGLERINDALEEETDDVIETGRLVANIIVVIAFVLLMLNILFKVMDNSKASVVFLFILFLRGLYEVIF